VRFVFSFVCFVVKNILTYETAPTYQKLNFDNKLSTQMILKKDKNETA